MGPEGGAAAAFNKAGQFLFRKRKELTCIKEKANYKFGVVFYQWADGFKLKINFLYLKVEMLIKFIAIFKGIEI